MEEAEVSRLRGRDGASVKVSSGFHRTPPFFPEGKIRLVGCEFPRCPPKTLNIVI